MDGLETLLTNALTQRADRIADSKFGPLRLFNGFFEGDPSVCIDLFNDTALIYLFSEVPDETKIRTINNWLLSNLSTIRCVIVKQRYAKEQVLKRGMVLFGSKPTEMIIENLVHYKIDLMMNHDSSFYLDTKNLRSWIKVNSVGKKVLNTFAYTGSLGVAALAGGAEFVYQLDRNQKFLDIADQSARLNGFDQKRYKCLSRDFFLAIGQFKKTNVMFDMVILDPPFFSATDSGKVDLEGGFIKLVNKVRPLIKDGGKLVCINNALFVSGAEMIRSIDHLCESGYVSLDRIIPVDQDFVGYATDPAKFLPSDPHPFNHSTKIIVLNIKKKPQ